MTDEPYEWDAVDRVCLHCHAPADPSHRFCGRCGSPLHTRCTACLAVVAPGLDFCTNCGRPLTPGRLGSGESSRNERRTVSVLFVDLIGFTGVAERLDPEDLHALQVAYFSTASGVIRRYGGIVEKYIGDAVMAVFGVPVETEHDAYRAVVAALDLQRQLDNRPLAGRYRMRARVGIATGEALVDLGAARHAGQALVSGDVVATAARLQQHAPNGRVLVASATRHATVGAIRYTEESGTVSLAGRSTPVETWLAEEPARQRRGADEEEVTPFVGREQELDLLTTGLMRCLRDRSPQLVSVVGAHGIGKSRLIRELHRRVHGASELLVRWRTGRCLPYGEGGAYDALAEIIKAQADVLDTDDSATARARIAAAVGELVPDARVDRLTDLLGPLAGLPGRSATSDEAEAAWRETLLALGRHLPTVLVIEDLHYAQPGMLRFLSRLVDAATDVPLFVLCTYRPELLDDHPTWAAGLPGTLTVSLGPLRGPEFTSLIATLVSEHGLPTDLADRLATITAGNPMYAVEYVRMLAERTRSGDVDIDADLAIPVTVHGVIANRIDLLDPGERTTLHAAAVLGDNVWPSAIAAMLDSGVVEVDAALSRLRRRDMLTERPVSAVESEPELGFRHQLLREVAYRRLPRGTRALLHRRAAAWFARVSTGRHDLAAAVARHRVAALKLAESLNEDTTNDTLAAREALATATHAAFAVHAVEPALDYATQALTLWPLNEQPEARRAMELLRCRLAFAADVEGFYRSGGAKELARLAEQMSETGDIAGAAQAAATLGGVELMRAERGRAREHLSHAVTLFAALPDSPAKAEAYGELARLHLVEYQPAQALNAARTAGTLARRLGLTDSAANSRITELSARYSLGDPGVVAELEEVVAHCRDQQLPSLRRAAHNLSVIAQEEGDLSRAMELQAESLTASGASLRAVLSHSEAAERAYFSGDWGLLLQSAEQYLDDEDAETTEWDLQLRAQRAWIRALCGEPSGAETERCLDSARRSGFSRLCFSAFAHGALCRAIEGDHAAAAALLAELASSWPEAPTPFTMEWLSAAAHAAALLAPRMGSHPTDSVNRVVTTVVRQTPWTGAAADVTAGARALAGGRPAEAAERFEIAMAIYERVGGISDATLAATWAARARRAAGDEETAGTHLDRVAAFAERNRAAVLVDIANR